MAVIQPFLALRPNPKKAAQIAAVPYDVVNREEAHQLAAGNPLSFLHISRSEIDLPLQTHPYSDTVYEKAKANLEQLIQTGALIRDSEPALYLYRLKMFDHLQIGIAGCFSVDEYDAGLIKKHERTRKEKEDDRTRHILTLSAQTGPVFLTYRNDSVIEGEMNKTIQESTPIYDFTAADGIGHTVWKISKTDLWIKLFATRIPMLYIADGHHRAASASRARAALSKKPGNSNASNFFLAVAFPDHQMKIYPYHRVIKDLGGQTPDQFLKRLDAEFTVHPDPTANQPGAGEFGMYLNDRWYRLILKDGLNAESLDVSLLQEKVLAPILGITDPRTDPRIDFVGGIRGPEELERRVRSGESKVAFAMHPTQLSQVMEIADQNGIMPPKSTWFEPKLRDGLLIHCLDD